MPPRTLIQRIALDGGREIREELEALGREGKRAFEQLEKAAKDTAATGSRLNQFVRKVREDFKRLARDSRTLRQGLTNLGSGLRTVATRFTVLAAAATAAAGALFLATRTATQAADQARKQAQALGLTTREYGRLQFALEQGGLAQSQFSAGFRQFSRVIGEASRGVLTDGSRALQELGISVVNAAGQIRPTEEIFGAIADRLRVLPDGATKTAFALRIFGRQGASLIPTLNAGSAAIKQLGDRAEELQLVFTDDEGKIGEAFNDQLNELFRIVGGLRNKILLLFAPVFTEVSKNLTDFLVQNAEAIKQFGQEVLTLIGPVFADIARLIKGEELETDFVITLVAGFRAVESAARTAFKIIETGFNLMAALIQPILDIINTLFGTELEAKAVLLTTLFLGFVGVLNLIPAIITTISGLILLLGPAAKVSLAGIIGVVLAVVGAIALLRFVINGIGDGFRALSDLAGPVLESIASGFTKAVDLVSKFFTDLGNRFSGFFNDVVQFIAGLIPNIGKLIVDGFTAAVDAVIALFEDLLAKVTGIFTSIAEGIGGIVDTITGALADIFGGSDSPQGFRSGGFVSGPGTGTSDSIPARLSDGEFVQRAAAVRKYGVDFMTRLNRLQIPLGAIRGFADGGLVQLSPVGVPSIPDSFGGSSGGDMRPLHLTIGAETFGDLLAPDAVAKKLIRYASDRNIRSAGRKPDWHGG